jgi:hypothetical protein
MIVASKSARPASDSVTGSAFDHRVDDGAVQQVGVAEIAPQQVAVPVDGAFDQRPVDAELLADLLDLFGGGVGAADFRRDVAGHQPHDDEGHQRHDEEHRDGAQDSSGEEQDHVIPSWAGRIAGGTLGPAGDEAIGCLVGAPDVVDAREAEGLEAFDIGARGLHLAGVAKLDDPEVLVEALLDLGEGFLARFRRRAG